MNRESIEVNGISFFFSDSEKKILVLDNLTVSIKPNEFISIVGLSGCGKSTLLHLFAGFFKPTTGTILFENNKIETTSSERIMVFQEDSVFPWFSVLENIQYSQAILGKEKEEIEKTSIHYLKSVGLEAFKDYFPKSLSGGMKKRVDLARAYAANPKVLLMDEPFGALDAHTRQKMQLLLLNLWQQEKKTIIFVTHDINEAVFLSDRVIVMSASPGTIHKIYDINLSRPRNTEIKKNKEFIDLASKIENEILQLENLND